MHRPSLRVDEAREINSDQFLLNSSEDMEVHPLANLFPEMEGEEFEAFLKDIRENGQNEPVVILEDEGKKYLLDGRHRAKASKITGIPLKAKLFTGSSPLDFVVSSNIHRRHLTASQKAMVAAKILNDPRYGIREAAEERQKEAGKNFGRGLDSLASPDANLSAKATEQAAALVGASGASTERAQYVMKHGTPEDVQDVLDGKATVTGKKAEVQRRTGARQIKSSRPKNSKKSKMIDCSRYRSDYPKTERPTEWEETASFKLYEALLLADRYLSSAQIDGSLAYSEYPKESDLYDTIAMMEILSSKFSELSGRARGHLGEVQRAKKIEAISASESLT